uniref:Uncharacterized protein n=1 Tax=Craspedostauros australis TaxID=1486917 RepID=A0A7R9X065_9STRA|mmetsp:Transcript_4680/g.12233  ORF Transcript_4680/g.12233 Transcript_4680/m.12233 type:complete len:119 (+) Transcript_4680:67-423(+)
MSAQSVNVSGERAGEAFPPMTAEVTEHDDVEVDGGENGSGNGNQLLGHTVTAPNNQQREMIRRILDGVQIMTASPALSAPISGRRSKKENDHINDQGCCGIRCFMERTTVQAWGRIDV